MPPAPPLVLSLAADPAAPWPPAGLDAILAAHGMPVRARTEYAGPGSRGERLRLEPAVPESGAGLRDVLFAWGRTAEVDLALVPEAVHAAPKRLAVFDMDSTLVAAEVVDLLADRAGIGAEVASVTARTMAGELDFAGSLRRRVALLAGLPESVLAEVAAALPLNPGAAETVAGLRGSGCAVVVLSGGFTVFTDALVRRLGLDHARANVLAVEGGRLTGALAGPVLDGPGKAAALEELARERGLSMAQVVAVGDGANDAPMLRAAGAGIAYRAREPARRAADGAIHRAPLTGLLHLVGTIGDGGR